MSDEGEVRFERHGARVTLTFDRPDARNAMTWKMYDELEAHCESLADDPEARVVVLRGEGGKAFIAGTDIGQFKEFESGEDGIDYERRIERIVQKLEALPMPTIAAVEGYAVGGGLTISAVCDLRVCSSTAKFGLPIARTLGNCVSIENISRLVWMIGPTATKALIYRADFVDAERALALGLATEVVPEGALGARVDTLCEQLERHAPLTMAATKELTRRLMLEQLPEDEDIIRQVYGSDDFKEGTAAFVEKRQANWQNR
ncbi:enoyl-CoA hydratase [Egibacter rhizosphaerae]|uniref:Enoyl-CoA hydratase n=1 Tax=Egibacter rhizosphaerae TaxID=1670831 RepID=A0A411YBG9_9ACTN|nr:enoyl-CoA hydratase/isomerase family protein [Egibacter rhizosphaerae]QBI18571.1 enoyl-CoA hydratase [Egibacter rhizosphaerae]